MNDGWTTAWCFFQHFDFSQIVCDNGPLDGFDSLRINAPLQVFEPLEQAVVGQERSLHQGRIHRNDVGRRDVFDESEVCEEKREHVFVGGRSELGLAVLSTQVWSLTQFYSVDFSQSGTGVKSAFPANAQSRFASAVLDGVLGPPRLETAHLMVPIYLCSSGSNAQGELRAIEGRCVSSKSPSRVQDGNEGVCWAQLSNLMNDKFSKHRFWQCHENRLIKTIQTIPHNQ